MKKLHLDDYGKLRKLVCRRSRPLEYTLWKCVFESGDREEFLAVLSSYQNNDGGFGHNLEANNWNPASSPIITLYAIHQLERARCILAGDHPIVSGIVKYLASGEHMTDDGWLGSIPSNNDYSHSPWFHYDPESGADVGLTMDLADFVLKYADRESDIYQKATELKEKHKTNEKLAVPCFDNYNPAAYEPWNPSPASFVRSPDSEYYPGMKAAVDLELDTIVDRLHDATEFTVMHDADLREREARVPRKDGAKWNDREQIIGSYYWEASDYVSQIETLKTFGRLGFDLPVSGCN